MKIIARKCKESALRKCVFSNQTFEAEKNKLEFVTEDERPVSPAYGAKVQFEIDASVVPDEPFTTKDQVSKFLHLIGVPPGPQYDAYYASRSANLPHGYKNN